MSLVKFPKIDREVFMNMVDQKRAENPYPHKHCSEECKKRGTEMTKIINLLACFNTGYCIGYIGCGTLWSIDGNWKLEIDILNLHVHV